MALCLIAYDILRKIRKINVVDEAVNTKYVKGSADERQHRWVFYVITAIPGLSRTLSIGLTNIALLYLGASTWQVLQCSVMIFTILMDKFFRRKNVYKYEWFSLILMLAAVGFILASEILKNDHSSGATVGICLMILAQIIRAATYVLETSLFKNIRTKTTLFIGLEGFWGFLIVFAFIIPIANVYGGQEGNGAHEDLFDAVKLLANNTLWIIPEAFILVLSIPYAMSHAHITSQGNPQRLPLLEGSSALIVWIVEIIMYYALKGSVFGNNHPNVGESIEIDSIYRFVGFIFTAVSVIIYSKLLPFDWMYPVEMKNEKTAEDDGVSKDEYNI